MVGLSESFGLMGHSWPNWVNNSDLWVATSAWHGKGTTLPGPWTYKTVDTSNPADPAFRSDSGVYQAMAGMIRINGLVMGPPPFPVDPNWKSPLDWSQTSNVQLGQSSGTTSGTSSTFDVSVTAGIEATVTAPFVKDQAGYSFTYGYAATHSTETSFTNNYTWTLGTVDQTLSTLGKLGWMVGHAPVIWPMSYLATSIRDPGPTGTYMGYSQMMLTVSGAESLFWPYSLTNPSDTSYPMGFLLAGVQAVPASTDVDGWNIYQGGAMLDWSDTSKGDWTVIGGAPGSGLFTIDELNMGSQQTQQFVRSTTKGKDWSDTYTLQYSNSLRLGIKGDNVSANLDLSAGYETQGSSSTTFQQNMETSYTVPFLQGGYTEIQIQPYLLQAQTYNAPWVPKGYKGPLPWAITWDVTYAAKSQGLLGAPQTIYARTTLPERASGRITGSAAPKQPKAKTPGLAVNRALDDSYSITRGQLSYIGPDKSLIPIALTADDFSPTKGVTILINGHRLSATSASGIWRRSGTPRSPGQVWTYASSSGPERLRVSLDFGALTWDLQVSHTELGDAFAGMKDTATVTLDLNGRYVLSTRIAHGVAYKWAADLSTLDQPLEVDTISVNQGLQGPQQIRVKGKLTDRIKTIGDTSLIINATGKDYKLASMPGFFDKVRRRMPIRYQDATGRLAVDLKSGHWIATADRAAFPDPRPMYHGEAELRIKIAGKDYFSAYVQPDSYVLDLSFELLK